ncbi:LOW QUALITY PROTEIN: innexin shaking-B-like [Portunus trituberculatus]|uniref:LOW QUALITY PROTEIN: innexin shaking-B-like n=1 Tax=Portunus trituberculatus TaxID=210409 RepID=UPI001E1CE887|nr:LOW QUALITY PROTEIN: innexin shaking-B-like [Portunus trituberculatus]
MGENKDDGKKKQGGGKENLLDVRRMIESVLGVVKSHATKASVAPCDGLVLRMHYRWTFWALLAGFLAIWHSWYHKHTITCVSHFNAETPVKEEYVNVCLSYPYLAEEGGRRYILFYRWVHWSFLVLTIIFYLPRKVSKSFENMKCKKVLEDLYKGAETYDEKEAEIVEKAHRYMCYNIRTHNGLYWKYLVVNVMALFIDIMAMVFLDFVLQGRFIWYGYMSHPFARDPQKFTDYMSQTFPPFVWCELSPDNQLVSRRTEKFGCHLTVMELYEKVFLGLWLWLILLILITSCYIIFLLSLLLPCVRLLLLRFSKPRHISTKVTQLSRNVLKVSKIGDVFMLYRLRQQMSHAMFYEVVIKLTTPGVHADAGGKGQGQDANIPSPDTKKTNTFDKKQNTKSQKGDFKESNSEKKILIEDY